MIERLDSDIRSINENSSITGGDASIDTQLEIDIISSGVGFDDDISENLKNNEKDAMKKEKGG